MALKYIRDNLKSFFWVLWIVILAMVGLVFFGWGGYNQRANTSTDVAATIGGEKITFGEFRGAYQRLESYYRQAFGERFDADMAKQFNLPAQALNQLINERILLREARAIGLRVTDEEVRDQIVNDPNLQRNGRFVGAEEYEQLLRRNRLTPAEYHASIRKSLLLQKLDSALAASTYVSDEAVEKAYREQVERAKIRFVVLPASQVAEVEVAQADLEAYLAEHADEFEVPEQRSVSYLLVDSIRLQQEMEVSDEDVRAYYDAHPDLYTQKEQVRARHILRKITPERPADEARAEIEDIRRRIEAGEDFAALARELSEDEVSARAGGLLKPFGRGEMLPPFEEAAFGAADGELVGPVKTTYGFHLIEKLGSTPAGLQPFDQVRATIRARLVRDRAAEEAETKALDIASRVTAETTDEELKAVAEEEGLELVTTEPFGANDTVTGIGLSPTFNQAAFNLEVGGVSAPIKVPRGWAVMKLREIREPHRPELAEIEDQVRQAVAGERRRAAALDKLREAAAAGTGLDDLAGELGLEVKESAEFARNGTIAGLGRQREVIDAALALDVGEVGGPFATSDGAVLFEVTERTKFDPAEFAKAKESTRATEEQQRLMELKQMVIAKRRGELEPSFNPKVLENFGLDNPGRG